ncbi:MAG: hypothetical protein KKA81_08460 [Bacteroidetes bacterium]|nr:hypothetical protein [Bacteroidota bacterium]
MKASSTLWLKAAIIGSLWAGNEIILGSFLHNLRVPFSGTLLSVISVALMTGFLQIWKERGLILRAGIICALMKSISPSAIIIGPMTGILAEALLMELFITLAGRNIIGYLLGGIAGVVSALFHKIITLLIIYGADFVRVLENLYNFAVRQLSLENVRPLEAFILLCLIYVAAGIFAVIAGIMAGRRSAIINRELGDTANKRKIDLHSVFPENKQGSYSLPLILFYLIMIFVSLFLLNTDHLIAGFALSLSFTAIVAYYYKRSLRYLKKPGFWIQLTLLVVITSFFWEGFSSRNLFQMGGLLAGIKMVVRALVIVAGFAAISVELRSPVVRELLTKRGLSRLYDAMELAFSVLPEMTDGSIKPRDIISRPVSSLAQVIARGRDLFNEKRNTYSGSLTILTGPIDSGKTGLLKNLIDASDHLPGSRGFLSVKHFEEGIFKGYDLIDLPSGEMFVLCRLEGESGWVHQGRYFFNPETINKGNDIILVAIRNRSPLLIIDEIGPLELSGGGWGPSLEKIDEYEGKMVWVVRQSLTELVRKKWWVKEKKSTCLDISDDNIKEKLSSIIKSN